MVVTPTDNSSFILGNKSEESALPSAGFTTKKIDQKVKMIQINRGMTAFEYFLWVFLDFSCRGAG